MLEGITHDSRYDPMRRRVQIRATTPLSMAPLLRFCFGFQSATDSTQAYDGAYFSLAALKCHSRCAAHICIAVIDILCLVRVRHHE